MTDATHTGARFQLWIRRRLEPEAPYSIRFEVTDGKGILRVSRPDVLIDPPARLSGFEDRLTAPQVATTRFLLTWDGGRQRQAHSLARLEEGQLEQLPEDRWIRLAAVTDGATRSLVLPTEIERDPARVDDEPTWPRPQVVLAELQHELRQLDARPPDDDRTELRRMPVPLTSEPIEAYGLPTDARVRRAERVDIVPRSTPPAPPRPVAAPPAAGAFATLDALLNASLLTGAVDDDQTVLMGGSALAIDRSGAAVTPSRPVLPRLDPFPSPPLPTPEELMAIEAGEASGEDADDEFDLVGIESGQVLLEALEAPGDDDDDDEREYTDPNARAQPEVTDIGRSAAPEILQGSQITEPVTVFPYSPEEVASAARAAAPVEQGWVEVVDVLEAHAADAAELAPRHDFHERNTTLVRFLRRRMAADRTRIAALERRVADLEAELDRRPAR
ncbi:MAG: hypothetical protein Q8P41_01240 [Pseudomonadota bacterium]|nr:hypothetical protein [Pseudomonadota bacterium]